MSKRNQGLDRHISISHAYATAHFPLRFVRSDEGTTRSDSALRMFCGRPAFSTAVATVLVICLESPSQLFCHFEVDQLWELCVTEDDRAADQRRSQVPVQFSEHTPSRTCTLWRS